MYSMFSSFKIQDIFSKFTEFLTLQRLARKAYYHGFSWAILIVKFPFLTWFLR